MAILYPHQPLALKMLNLWLLYLYLYNGVCAIGTLTKGEQKVNGDTAGICTKVVKGEVKESNRSKEIYCFNKSERKEIHKLFCTLNVKIGSENGVFAVSRSDRLDYFKKEENTFIRSLASIIPRTITYENKTTEQISPFEDTFLKVIMKEKNTQHWIYVHELWFDKNLFLCFSLGIFLFCFAKSLCRHVSFIYLTGFTFGIFISWLLLLLILVKFLPAKRGLVTSVLLVGTNLGLFIARLLYDNIIYLILCYKTFAAWYFGIVGLVVFASIYYYDPARNVRFLNLVQWTFQLIGCYLVFVGTRIQEVSVTIIVLMVFSYTITQFISAKRILSTLYSSCLPYKLQYMLTKPKQRMLTNEEFEAEGTRRKREEFDHLREYCSSPECDSWRLISKLKDPKRFAIFMETGMDISTEERDAHDRWEDTTSRDWFTSDEDETLNESQEEKTPDITGCTDVVNTQ